MALGEWKSIHECKVCGTIFDSKKPSGGNDYHCPLCNLARYKLYTVVEVNQNHRFSWIYKKPVCFHMDIKFVGPTYTAKELTIKSEMLSTNQYKFEWFRKGKLFQTNYFSPMNKLKVIVYDDIDDIDVYHSDRQRLQDESLKEWFKDHPFPLTEEDMTEFLLTYG